MTKTQNAHTRKTAYTFFLYFTTDLTFIDDNNIGQYLVEQVMESLQLRLELSVVVLYDSHPYFKLHLVLRQLLCFSDQFCFRRSSSSSSRVMILY